MEVSRSVSFLRGTELSAGVCYVTIESHVASSHLQTSGYHIRSMSLCFHTHQRVHLQSPPLGTPPPYRENDVITT